MNIRAIFRTRDLYSVLFTLLSVQKVVCSTYLTAVGELIVPDEQVCNSPLPATGVMHEDIQPIRQVVTFTSHEPR